MKDSLNSFLTFRLGEELFAASVGKVIEILEIPKITKVPRAPSFMRGVVNLRGNVLSVVDTRTKFGLPVIEDTINTCIIVMNVDVEGQDLTMGLIVDSVREVLEIERSEIQALPEIGSKYKTEFIEGMVKSGDQFIMLLNINYIFSAQDAIVLQDLVTTTNDAIV